MSTYLRIDEDEILFVAPGVCPPMSVRTHVCNGTFSMLGFTRVFKLSDVMVKPDGKRAEDRNCKFCGKRL